MLQLITPEGRRQRVADLLWERMSANNLSVHFNETTFKRVVMEVLEQVEKEVEEHFSGTEQGV